MDNEIWKPIKGWEDLYMVSNLGRVKSLGRTIIRKNGRIRVFPEKIIKPQINRAHYLIGLWKDNKVKRCYLHRPVAEAYIPNPNNFPLINHKDENPANNVVDNLEWCTPMYNTHYGGGIERKRLKNMKKVVQFSFDGDIIDTYNSLIEAEEKTGIKRHCISQCCHNKLKSAGGFSWIFLKDLEI